MERRLNVPYRVLALLVALLTLAASLLGVGPVSAVTPTYGYETASYVYDAPTRSSSPDTVATGAAVPPSGPVAVSCGSPVFARDRGVAANSVTGAYDVALAGGRHAGFLRNYAGKPTPQIERGIASIERQIAEHQAKIQNPSTYVDDWAALDHRQQQALLTSKWPGDIARQQEQLDILRGILGSR